MTARRRSANLAALVASVAMTFLSLPAAADAVPILQFSALPSTTEAGGHPDIAISFRVDNRQQIPSPCGCDDPKNLITHLPTGLIANPHATPQCTIAEFSSGECPVDSQIGVIEARASEFGEPYCGPPESCTSGFLAPIFNIVPPPGDAALSGFKLGLFNSPVFEIVSSRTNSDYGLDVSILNTAHFLPLFSAKQVIWGVPAEATHDYLRFAFRELSLLGGQQPNFMLCNENGEASNFAPSSILTWCPQPGDHLPVGSDIEFGGTGSPVSSTSPPVPFWQNPTTCGVASLATSLDVLDYVGELSHADSGYPPTTDCAQLKFDPSLFARPTTDQTDSASGADIDLKAPSFESATVPSPSEIRAATITLPPGFTINPSVTNGKVACTDAEAQFGTTLEAHCPEFAKIGTVEVHSAVLPGPLPGALYIGQPLPGERYRVFLTADGFGLHVKLAGTVRPDPVSGRVVVEFANLPQSPFEDFFLHFFGSERGVLATPTQCGTYSVATEFEPWDAALPVQTSAQTFTLEHGPDGSACPNGPRPFTPQFSAASASNTAGVHTAFSLDLSRNDGEQNLKGLSVTTPPGFLASLSGVSYCPESAIAAAAAPGASGLLQESSPSCPAASLVGQAISGAGAGDHPFFAPGKVYLGGPYEGAPLSLVVVTPAVAGPFDLGNVVVRAALHVDPETAQVTAVTNALPKILEGIPLRLRSIMINLNRPGFALNPTDCDPLAVTAQISGEEAATSNSSTHFQVANCASLAYNPKLSLKLSGGLNRLGHPAIHSVLTTKPGEANSSIVSVALPKGEILDNAHIRTPCTRVELNAETCPPGSVLGHAVAVTPLLEKPLEGPVYLTTGFGHELPDLIADLKGQIHIQLDGKVDTVNHGSLRTTFQTIPDAPVSSFTLNLAGGSKGLIQNEKSLCGAHNRVTVQMKGQNGKSTTQHPELQVSCRKGNGASRSRKVHKNRSAHR